MRMLECAGKSYRMTRQRQAVLEVLKQANAQPDAAWVYEEVRKEMPNISLGTVYRTMSLLREAGLISAAKPTRLRKRCDSKGEGHCQVACIRCGQVVDSNVAADSELEQEIAAATGFIITGHRLEFYGLCPNCAPKDIKS